MVTNKEVTYKFDWGEEVDLTADAPKGLLKTPLGGVCGIQEVESEYMAKKYGVPLGTIMYLVEGSTGEAREIPEKYLVKYGSI